MHVCMVSYKVSIAKKYENFTVTAGNGGGQLKWLFHLFISSFVQLKRPHIIVSKGSKDRIFSFATEWDTRYEFDLEGRGAI